jgi:CP family cyanate transporter-like MFS transporter
LTKTKFLTGTFVALLFYAVALRAPIASIGPLLHEISDSLHLDLTQQGVLTAIPVLSFGIGAFASPAFARRFGLDHSLLILCAALVVAIALRGWFDFISLLIGTTVAGLAIAIANVLLPSVVRDRFPNHIGLVTASYTTVLAISASLAAASAVPLSSALGSWQMSLFVWIAPMLVALVLWWIQLDRKERKSETQAHVATSIAITRSPVTWALFLFFGIQSLGFYAILSWLPSVLIDQGLDPAAAGGLLGLTTIVGVPFSMLLASNFSRFKRLDIVGFLISMMTLCGFVLLNIDSLHFIACICLGLGMACTFPLSLNLISTRASDPKLTTQLSTVVQGYGYLLSALGTFAFGWLRDVTGGWVVSIALMAVLTGIQALSSFVAGGKRHIK